MSNIKQLKNRVNTVQFVKKITNTMHMISSFRLSRLKCIYSDAKNIRIQLKNIAEGLQYRADKQLHSNKMYIIIGSEKGLCGSFNNKIRCAIKNCDFNSEQDYCIAVGTKTFSYLNNMFNKNKITYLKITDNCEQLFLLAKKIISCIIDYNIQDISLIFNISEDFFSNKVTQMNLENNFCYSNGDVDVDQLDDKNFISVLKNKILLYEIYYSLMSSKIAEESSRMIAMNNAVTNCTDLAEKLTLKMHKIRQASITGEIIEIISSAQAIQSN